MKDYGPGWIVDQHLFVDAIEKGLKSVNMGDGYGYYKSRWGAVPSAHLRNYIVFQPSLVGQGMRLAALSKERLQRLRLSSRKSVAGMKSVIEKLVITG
jgi:hypothetical protein